MHAEDEYLDFGQLPALNKQFYRGDPFRYFNARIQSLLLIVSDSEHVRAAFRDGLKLGALSVQTGGDDEPYSADESRDYATVESLAILQHVCESFLRLVIAHLGLPPSPWLEIARLKNFGEFYKRMDELEGWLESPEAESGLRQIFRGDTEAKGIGMDASDPRWAEDGRDLRELVRVAIRTYRDQRVAYATKHGLAVIPHELGLELSGDLEQLIVGQDGPAISYLELSSAPRKWRQTTRWVDAGKGLGLAVLIADQIRSLWSIARARYIDDDSGKVLLVPGDALAEVVRPTIKDGGIPGVYLPSFTMDLVYWARDDEPGVE